MQEYGRDVADECHGGLDLRRRRARARCKDIAELRQRKLRAVDVAEGKIRVGVQQASGQADGKILLRVGNQIPNRPTCPLGIAAKVAVLRLGDGADFGVLESLQDLLAGPRLKGRVHQGHKAGKDIGSGGARSGCIGTTGPSREITGGIQRGSRRHARARSSVPPKVVGPFRIARNRPRSADLACACDPALGAARLDKPLRHSPSARRLPCASVLHAATSLSPYANCSVPSARRKAIARIARSRGSESIIRHGLSCQGGSSVLGSCPPPLYPIVSPRGDVPPRVPRPYWNTTRAAMRRTSRSRR